MSEGENGNINEEKEQEAGKEIVIKALVTFSYSELMETWDKNERKLKPNKKDIVYATVMEDTNIKKKIIALYTTVGGVDSLNARRNIMGDMVKKSPVAAGRLEDVAAMKVMSIVDALMREKGIGVKKGIAAK